MLGLVKYYYKRINYKRFRKLIKSKAFVGSILFAAALWSYTSLNHEYTPLVKIPLTVVLPEGKAIENELPNSISIKVKGGGWQLFYLIFFNSSKKCIVDLRGRDIPENELTVGRMDILKGIQDMIDVEPIDVLPESLKIVTGRMITAKVAVNPIIRITPREGFIAMSDFIITPDSIEITGNEKTINKLKYWNTKKINIDNIYSSQTIPIELSDSIDNRVKLSQNFVDISIDVQQLADVTIYDAPIEVRGGAMPKNHRLSPDKITVIVQGGVNKIAGITKYDIKSYVDYKDIIEDSTGIIRPKIEISQGVNQLYIQPQYIYHFRTSKGEL